MAAAEPEEPRRYDVGRTAVYRQQLGEDSRSAQYALTRVVLLALARKLGLANCFRCGGEIEPGSPFHLDHVTEWVDSDDPPALFWDPENVRLSHPLCNRRMQRRYKSRIGPDGTMLCTKCAEYKPTGEFAAIRGGKSISSWCKKCSAKRRREWGAARRAARRE